MARAKTTVRGRAPLARDSQQWILDYVIQETGKTYRVAAPTAATVSLKRTWFES